MEDTFSKNLTEGALERNLYKVFRIDQNTSKLRVSLVLIHRVLDCTGNGLIVIFCCLVTICVVN